MLKLEVSYRGLIFAALGILTLYALYRLWPLVLLVFTAFIFMAAFLPFVEWMVRHRIPRVVGVLLIVLGTLAVVAGAFALVVPAMYDEFRDLRDNLPENGRQADEFLSGFGLETQFEQRASQIDWGSIISGQDAVQYGQRALSIGLAILTVIVLSAYLLVEAPRLSQFLYQFVSPGKEPQVDRILQSLRRVVGGFVRGQAITSVAIGVYTFAILFALGVPNAIALGVIAAFADIIPLIGATIATVPPVLVASQESFTISIVVLVLLLAYQQFEDRYFSPKVYGSTLNLPPFVVLLTILAGAELLGIAGVLLGLPAAAIGRVAWDFWLEKRTGNMVPGPTDDPAAPDQAGSVNV